MSMPATYSIHFANTVLLVSVLSISACHSSSDNNNPPNESSTPTLSESNWRLVVGRVLDAFTQTIYDDVLLQPEYPTIASHYYTFPFSNSRYASYSEHDCTDGGVATNRRSPTSCDGRCYSSITMFYACSSSDHSSLGRVETESGYSHRTDKYDSLTVTTEGTQQLQIDGELSVNRSGSTISNNVNRSATLKRYESTTSSGTTVLTDVDTVFGYGTDPGSDTASAQMQGTLTLSSPETGGVPISAAVTVPFINESSEDRRFPRGTLELQAQDGSGIVLTADNEDADTFEVTMSRDNVDTVVFSEPWADWIERLSFD